MEDTLVLLIPIFGILMGGLVVLIPITGLTARFAAKPIVDMIAKARQQGSDPDVALLAKRFDYMEQQIDRLEEAVGRLMEEREFERRLAAASRADALAPGRGPGEE